MCKVCVWVCVGVCSVCVKWSFVSSHVESKKCWVAVCLFAVLALDPAGNVESPGEWSTEGSEDVVPLDPRSRGEGAGCLLEDKGLLAGVDARSQKDEREDSEHARGHLGHDGSQDLGRRIITLPVHVLGFHQGSSGRSTDRRGKKGHRSGNGGAHLSDGSKARNSGNQKGKKDETELDHFCLETMRVSDDYFPQHLMIGDTSEIKKKKRVFSKFTSFTLFIGL